MKVILIKNGITQKGFTLVETLVAISVLLLVIIGPMTVAQKGIQNAYYANEQVTATFLAQEAIEAVRTLRDTQALVAFKAVPGGSTIGWIPTGSCPDNVACAYTGSTFGTCALNNNCILKYDANTKKYSHTSGVDSPFVRKVTIQNFSNISQQITVEVTWTNKIFGSTQRSVKLQTWLYDHYKRYEN